MNEKAIIPTGPQTRIGTPAVVACLTLRDAVGAVEFYKEAFGAVEIDRASTVDGRLVQCHLEINGGPLMLRDAFPEHGDPLRQAQGFVLHLHVADSDAWWARAVRAGAEAVLPIHVAFRGERYGEVRDPFGVTWAIIAP